MSKYKFKVGDRVVVALIQGVGYGPQRGELGTVAERLAFDRKRPEHALYEVKMDNPLFDADTWPFNAHELEKVK